MGRRNSEEDDWRGWLDGKYDNRYSGNFRRNRNKTKTVTVGIVFLLIIGLFGYILYDQGYLDATIKNSPQSIQDVSKDAKEFVTETTEKITKTIKEQINNIPLEPIEIPEIKLPDIPISSPLRVESGFDSNLVENYIYEFTNDERQKHGLSSLAEISIIDSIARNHSLDMSNRNFYSHDTPEGLDSTDRGNKVGYNCKKDFGSYYTIGLAENIAQAYTYSSYMTKGVTSSYNWLEDEETLAKELVDGWMNSQGHRENILNKQYDRIGVGVAINQDETVYATQNFC